MVPVRLCLELAKGTETQYRYWLIMENAFDHSFFGILLSLAEVSVSLTAFAGIVVAVGRRSSGEWSLVDRTRFAQVISNGVFALLYCLLPFLIIDPNIDLTEDSWSSTLISVGILGLIEFQYRFRRAWPVIKAQLDEDSGTGFQWLPWAYSGFSFFTYILLFLVIFDFVNILPFKVLLIVITMHIASGIWMFLRMVRH